ncbi:hypothetical protein EAI_03801 [Harpegnathos saltator]|uniref:Uncharacterized protein n=1 Tax=Harpegnathos saltator TaxID=610380 RepID=E2BT90_HARSA|nr:hypothetical protein EAI_03801 [Harpegnathos saltator]
MAASLRSTPNTFLLNKKVFENLNLRYLVGRYYQHRFHKTQVDAGSFTAAILLIGTIFDLQYSELHVQEFYKIQSRISNFTSIEPVRGKLLFSASLDNENDHVDGDDIDGRPNETKTSARKCEQRDDALRSRHFHDLDNVLCKDVGATENEGESSPRGDKGMNRGSAGDEDTANVREQEGDCARGNAGGKGRERSDGKNASDITMYLGAKFINLSTCNPTSLTARPQLYPAIGDLDVGNQRDKVEKDHLIKDIAHVNETQYQATIERNSDTSVEEWRFPHFSKGKDLPQVSPTVVHVTGCALGVERRGQCFPSKAKGPGEPRLGVDQMITIICARCREMDRVYYAKFITGQTEMNVPATRVGLTINPGLLIHNSNATRSHGDPSSPSSNLSHITRAAHVD